MSRRSLLLDDAPQACPRCWAEAGLADRIDARTAAALVSLVTLTADGLAIAVRRPAKHTPGVANG